MRHRVAEIALVLAAASLLLSAVLFRLNYDQQSDIKDALGKIQQNRVVLTRQSCRQRNQERAIQRANLRQNLRNLRQVPDAALEQLGFTRAEAVAQVRRQLRQVAPLNCKRLVKQVSKSSTSSARPGGGSGSLQGTRRTPGRENASGPPGGSDGSAPPSGPETPPEPGPTRPGPVPGGGEGGVSPGDDGSESAGGLVDRVQTTGDRLHDEVNGTVDQVQQVVPKNGLLPSLP